MDKRENIRVIIRIRPLNKKEKNMNCCSVVEVGRGRTKGGKEVFIIDRQKQRQLGETGQWESGRPRKEFAACRKKFTFDEVYDEDTSTGEIYHAVTIPIVEGLLQGYNGTILAYGQTGSGKTFTMQGSGQEVARPETPKADTVASSLSSLSRQSNAIGIIQEAIDHIFNAIAVAESGKFLVTASYLQIYNDHISDLLNSKATKLDLRSDGGSGVDVLGLTWLQVNSYAEAKALLDRGAKNRVSGATDMNQESSRSHAIFTLKLEQVSDEGHVRVGRLHLVDLAGSERQAKTHVDPDSVRFREATNINLSLSALGNVISALTDGKGAHIPYRDSKLTRLLQNSLGGNAKTLMICNVSPADYNHEETLQTLRFAARAKTIKNRPSVNEDPKDATLREMALEIQRLKANLEAKEKQLASQKVQQREELEELVERRKMEKRTVGDATEVERARRETMDKLKLLYRKLVGGEKKDDSDARRKRNTLLQECEIAEHHLSETSFKSTERDPEEEIDHEGHILKTFENLNEELEFVKEKLREEVERRERAESESEDLKTEFGEKREELLEMLRQQEWLLKEHIRKGMLLEEVVDQLWQLTEPNCNYFDLEEVVRQSMWDNDSAKWTVPTIRFSATSSTGCCTGPCAIGGASGGGVVSGTRSTSNQIKLPPIEKSNGAGSGGCCGVGSAAADNRTANSSSSNCGSRTPETLRLPTFGTQHRVVAIAPYTPPTTPLLQTMMTAGCGKSFRGPTPLVVENRENIEHDDDRGVETRCPTPAPPPEPTSPETPTSTTITTPLPDAWRSRLETAPDQQIAVAAQRVMRRLAYNNNYNNNGEKAEEGEAREDEENEGRKGEEGEEEEEEEEDDDEIAIESVMAENQAGEENFS